MTRLTKKELGFKIALFFLCRLNKILLIFKTTQDVEGLESINNSSLKSQLLSLHLKTSWKIYVIEWS